jgi:hypothetical protein
MFYFVNPVLEYQTVGREKHTRFAMKVKIPHKPVHILLFLLLAFLCYQAHQLVRHLVGAGLCSGFGSMTFTVATPRQPCSFPIIETLSGPILTYGLAWFGMLLLRSRKHALLAYALIFASFAHLRFIQTLTGRGDELVLAQQWSVAPGRSAVATIVFLIGIPPVYAAFRAIANRWRLLVFVCSWLLPIPVLFGLLFGDKFLFEIGNIGRQLGSFFGIWTVVLITDLLASALFIMLALRYLRPQARV